MKNLQDISFPLVTIMIPTYNQALFIEQTVESALSQTYQNLEVVVSDDNSSDNTSQILKRFESEPRFIYNRNPKNLGRVGNYRHLLYKLSHGNWVINLDGDDFFTDENFVQEAVNITQEFDVVLVGAKYCKQINDKSPINHPSLFDNSKFRYKILDGLHDAIANVGALGMGHLTEMYNAKLARDIGFYNQDIITADSESMLRLLMHGKFGFLNKQVAVWRHHGSNASQDSDFEYFYETFRGFDSVYQYGIKLEKDSSVLDTFRSKSYTLLYQRIFRKIYQTKDISQLPILLQKITEDEIVSVRSIFYQLGMMKKTIHLLLLKPRPMIQVFLTLYSGNKR